MSHSIIKSSAKKLQRAGSSLERYAGLNKSNNNSTILVIDKSSSMNENVGSMTKWEHLIHAVNQHFNDDSHLCIAFSCGGITYLTKCLPSELNNVSPQGGTEMHYAFQYILENNLHEAYESIVVISDGETYGEDMTIQEAKKLGRKIDCIFIGHEKSDGWRFIRRLAKECDGKSDRVGADKDEIKLLGTKITGLLGSGKGPIQL